MEIKAPNNYQDCPHPWVFLAGSIEMGKATNWQQIIKDGLYDITVLNPRRADWDSSWVQSIENPKFKEQVEWELKAQDDSDIILMHFEPDTLSPITLLELGLYASRKLIVHCPDGYWRKGNVDITCKWRDVEMVNSIEELIEAVCRRVFVEGITRHMR